MSRTTDALVVPEAAKPFQLTTIILSSIAAHEVLVEMAATGICHTDLSCAAGLIPSGFPGVYGHEGAGTVVEVGSSVSADVKPGDKVLLSFYHCQKCGMCEAGHPAYCEGFGLNFAGRRPVESEGTAMSIEDDSGSVKPVHSSFFGQSSFARLSLVHESCIVKVSGSVHDLALYAPLGCGLQTGAGAVLNTLNVTEGSTLAVFGVGSVGMSAVMAGKIRGAQRIIAVDLQQQRLDLARELGATDVILGSDDELVDKVRQICASSGGGGMGKVTNGVNFAVDCSGVPAVVQNMIDCLGTRGRAATVGAPSPDKNVQVNIWNQLVKGTEYVGCCEGDSEPGKMVPYLMEQHAKGNYPIDKVVTFYDVKDFEKAISDTKDGKTLKAVLRW